MARYTQAVAVSAIGLVGSWPAGAYLDRTLSTSRGKAQGGLQSFPADFSTRGAKVALTAPGVGVVSTISAGRWGVMSGTSMATPIATGVLARPPIIHPMSRYVFFNSDVQDAKRLTAAKQAARARGATVVKSLAGTMLLELAPAKVTEVAQALPGWRYSAERKTTRVPERKPLERAKARSGHAAGGAKE